MTSRLDKLFESKEDFKKRVDALWKTRAGLNHIYDTRPELRESILPQFKAINDIIGVLVSERNYHPSSGFQEDQKATH